VFASAGVGTVFAATTATVLVTQFKVDVIVFTGVAGGLKEGQKIGDIVLGTDVVNYDMDGETRRIECGLMLDSWIQD
jgi:adenosylhomocysteine nucleosidase